MGNAKLMKLLFYKDNFNADGRRMRAVLDREISNGVDTYRLWRSPGVPDQRYPRAENDTHSLYVEIGEYLVPLYMTDLELIYRSGEQPAITQLYGSDDGRRKYFQGLHKFGQADTAEISKTLQVERETIERLGSEPYHQANFVKEVLNEHMTDFITSKENGGETFPDFIGAAVLNEIALCRELSAKYRAKRRTADAAYKARAEAEWKKHQEETNARAQQQIDQALHVLTHGGELKNERIQLFRENGGYSDYAIVNHLMRRYGVNISLRTQGWVNEKLFSVIVKNGHCDQLRFRSRNGSRCSNKIFECINELLEKVNASSEGAAA